MNIDSKIRKTKNKLRLQHFLFTHKAAIAMFLAKPDNFIRLLEENGNDFLSFLWHCSGEDIDESDLANEDGLLFEMSNHEEPDTTIILITLPLPLFHSEAYFIALVYNPHKKLIRAYTLEYRRAENDGLGNVLCEWKVDGTYKILKVECDTSLEAFYKEVLGLI